MEALRKIYLPFYLWQYLITFMHMKFSMEIDHK